MLTNNETRQPKRNTHLKEV